MRTAFRKVWRDLWRHKGRTLLVVLSIAIGVMALGMIQSSNTLLERQLTLAQKASQPSHAILFLSGAVDEDTLRTFSRIADVQSIEGRLSYTVRYKNTLGAWNLATLQAIRDYQDQQFDLIERKQGNWPGRDTLAVAESQIASFFLPTIEQQLTLDINGRERAFNINGIVRDPFALGQPFSSQPTFYASKDLFNRLTGYDLYSEIRFTVKNYSPETVQAVSDQIDAQLKRQGMSVGFTQILDPEKHFAQSTVDGIGLILSVMAIASLGLSTFLVVNTMNALMVQQIPQIGIMKTIGASNRQVMSVYLSGVSVYGLLSLLLAVPLGALAGNALTDWMLAFLNVPAAKFEILPQALLLQIVTGLLVPLLAALYPVTRGVRISVREAVSNYGIGSDYGRGILDKILGKLRGLPAMLSLMLRNTFRRPGRVTMTELTLIVSGAVFMMVVSSQQSADISIKRILSSFGFDVLLSFEQFQRIDKIIPMAESRPHVERAEMWIFASAYAKPLEAVVGAAEKEVSLALRGLPADTQFFEPELTAGRDLLPEDGHALLLNQKIATDLSVSVGDQIMLDISPGGESTWTIVGLIVDLINGPDQNTAYVLGDILAAEMNMSGRGPVLQVRSDQDDVATMRAIQTDLREYFKSEGIGIGFDQNLKEIEEIASAQFQIITSILLGMTVLIATVGALGLSGTLSINVIERRREIGVMRAVGASSWDVGRVFVGEGLLLGILSWVQAIPLGYLGGKLFVDALGTALEFPFVYQFATGSVWAWLLIVVVLSIIASWAPARRATQISVNESLAYE